MNVLLDLLAEMDDQFSPPKSPEFPNLVGNGGSGGNGQTIDLKSVSQLFPISHQKIGDHKHQVVDPFENCDPITISDCDGSNLAGSIARVKVSCLEVGNVGTVGNALQNRGLSLPTNNLKNGKLGKESAGFCKSQSSAPSLTPNTPPAWRDACALFTERWAPCNGFGASEWPRALRVLNHFLEVHADTAYALGWTTVDLFGVHGVVGAARVDCCGALMLSGGEHIRLIEADAVVFRNSTYRRRPLADSIPVWQFDLEASR